MPSCALRSVWTPFSTTRHAVRMVVRAGQTVAAAKAVEESPDSTGQGSG